MSPFWMTVAGCIMVAGVIYLAWVIASIRKTKPVLAALVSLPGGLAVALGVVMFVLGFFGLLPSLTIRL